MQGCRQNIQISITVTFKRFRDSDHLLYYNKPVRNIVTVIHGIVLSKQLSMYLTQCEKIVFQDIPNILDKKN